MNRETVKLYNYHVWANRKLLGHLKQLPQGIDTEKLQSSFPSISDGLGHIYLTDNVWLMAMSRESYDGMMSKIGRYTEQIKGRTLDEFEHMYAETAERFHGFLEGRDTAEVNEYPHPQHGVLRASFHDLIAHIVNHGTYHRGNIAAMLRQLGHPGVSMDYVFYLYEVNR